MSGLGWMFASGNYHLATGRYGDLFAEHIMPKGIRANKRAGDGGGGSSKQAFPSIQPSGRDTPTILNPDASNTPSPPYSAAVPVEEGQGFSRPFGLPAPR